MTERIQGLLCGESSWQRCLVLEYQSAGGFRTLQDYEICRASAQCHISIDAKKIIIGFRLIKQTLGEEVRRHGVAVLIGCGSC